MDLSITEGIISGPGEWDEPVYRGQGLGSLMIAASAIVLNSKGVRTANLGGLSPSASGVWRKFGVQGGTPVDVKTILQLPQTDQIIRRYV